MFKEYELKQITMKEKEKVYLRRLTYSEVKYGYLRIVKKNCDQCPGPNKSIEIESDRGTFIKRMHSTQIGRIDGLTELYKDYDAKIGDNARVCFISKDKISISFSKGEDIFEKENREFSERTTLSETIERNRELCQTKTHLFCYNETNVRIELIEPILNALGWSIPDLAREIKCKDTSLKVDFALFKNNKCVLIIEAKSIDKALPQNPEDPNEKQLRKYLEDSRFNNAKYGILTNGQVWQIRNKNGKILRSIDILTNGKEDVAEKEIKEFFDLFKKDIDFDKQEK